MSGFDLSLTAHGEVRRRAGLPYWVTSDRAWFLYFATSRPAMSMSKEQRQRAASDRALEYDPALHRYRRKRHSRVSTATARL